MRPGKCYIGTSGWSYPHWAQGRFYPVGLKPTDWLSFLTEHFDTVEINTTFYHLPPATAVARWRAATGPRFRFAVKLWRQITHRQRLAACTRELKAFLAAAGELGPRRGPLLVQLPPALRRNEELLDDFLRALAKAVGPKRWPAAVEFRSPDWLCESVYTLLNRHRAAVCLADLPRCPTTIPNSAPLVYLRRHGPGGGYHGRYSADHIAADAAQVAQWRSEGRDVYVYYNNDADGHAVDNARQLREAVEG